MSRGRLVEALDSLIGSPSFRGEVVRNRHGVFTNADGFDPPSGVEALAGGFAGGDEAGPCTAYRHGRLRGKKRCHGCGRTRNEIEIDGG